MGRRMQGEGGYIKLYRSLTSWEWFEDTATAHLWIYILLRANYEPSMFRGIQIGRGEFLESYATMAKNTGLTVRQIRRALIHLRRAGQIDTQRSHCGTIVKVLNYAVYQDSDD